MRFVRLEVRRIRLPLRQRFTHALAERLHSDNVIVRVETDHGQAGHGEGILRTYLTGETFDDACATLEHLLAPPLLEWNLTDFRDLLEPLERLSREADAKRLTGAFCPLELAVLDAAGRHFGCAASCILDSGFDTPVHYSGVISASLAGGELERFVRGLAAAGLQELKIKVGDAHDLDRVRTARRVAGEGADLRVDANGAWTFEEAVASLEPMLALGITSVEQPLAATDIEGARRLRRALGIPVTADESLLTSVEAARLIGGQACDIFNVRLAKCGGMLNSRRLVGLALDAGLQFQVGCLVGETGLLSAAARQFARACPPARHYEGSYGRFLLERDIVREDVTFAAGGLAPPLEGPGLGVTVDDDALEAVTVTRRIIVPSDGRKGSD